MSLIEANDNIQIMRQLCALDFFMLKLKLVKEYTTYVKQVLKLKIDASPEVVNNALFHRQHFGGNIEETFSIYFLLITLNKYDEDVWYYMSEVKIDETNNRGLTLAPEDYAIEFYDKRLLTVEILFKNDRLIRVYFPLFPIFLHLSEATKKQFMFEVDRTSSQEKIMVSPDFSPPGNDQQIADVFPGNAVDE